MSQGRQKQRGLLCWRGSVVGLVWPQVAWSLLEKGCVSLERSALPSESLLAFPLAAWSCSEFQEGARGRRLKYNKT